jgi:hypothetical protein
VGLAAHEFGEAAQGDETPVAKREHDLNQDFPIHFPFRSWLGSQGFEPSAQRQDEAAQIIDDGEGELIGKEAALGVARLG